MRKKVKNTSSTSLTRSANTTKTNTMENNVKDSKIKKCRVKIKRENLNKLKMKLYEKKKKPGRKPKISSDSLAQKKYGKIKNNLNDSEEKKKTPTKLLRNNKNTRNTKSPIFIRLPMTEKNNQKILKTDKKDPLEIEQQDGSVIEKQGQLENEKQKELEDKEQEKLKIDEKELLDEEQKESKTEKHVILMDKKQDESKKLLLKNEKHPNANRKNTNQGRGRQMKLKKNFLKQKFGAKFLYCYVKIKRINHPDLESLRKERKNNRKTVSFVETVEVFSYYSPNGRLNNTLSSSSKAKDEIKNKTNNEKKDDVIDENEEDIEMNEPLSSLQKIGNTSTPVRKRSIESDVIDDDNSKTHKRRRRQRTVQSTKNKEENEGDDSTNSRKKRSSRSKNKNSINDQNQSDEISFVSDDESQEINKTPENSNEILKNGADIELTENSIASKTDEKKMNKTLRKSQRKSKKDTEEIEQDESKKSEKIETEENKSIENDDTKEKEINSDNLQRSDEKLLQNHNEIETQNNSDESNRQSDNINSISPSAHSRTIRSQLSNTSDTSSINSKRNENTKLTLTPTPTQITSEQENDKHDKFHEDKNIDNISLKSDSSRERSKTPTTGIHGRKSYRTQLSPVTINNISLITTDDAIDSDLVNEQNIDNVDTILQVEHDTSEKLQNKIFDEVITTESILKENENGQSSSDNYESFDDLDLNNGDTGNLVKDNNVVNKNNVIHLNEEEEAILLGEVENMKKNHEQDDVAGSLIGKLQDHLINEENIILTNDEDDQINAGKSDNQMITSVQTTTKTTVTTYDDDSDDSLLQSLTRMKRTSESTINDLFEAVKRSEAPKETRLSGSSLVSNHHSTIKTNDINHHHHHHHSSPASSNFDNVLNNDNDPNMGSAAAFHDDDDVVQTTTIDKDKNHHRHHHDHHSHHQQNDNDDTFSDADEFMATETNLNDVDDDVVVEPSSLHFSGTNVNDDDMILNQVDLVEQDLHDDTNKLSGKRIDRNEGAKFGLNKILKLFH